MYERRNGRIFDFWWSFDIVIPFGENLAHTAKNCLEDDCKQFAGRDSSDCVECRRKQHRADDSPESNQCSNGRCAGDTGGDYAAAVL